MKRYKDFIYSLNEILTPEQEHKVNTTYPEREPWIQNHLDNHLFSKGVDDVYEGLQPTEKTHTHKKIEDLLNKTLSARNPNHIPIEISKEDYKQGIYKHFVPRNPEFPESKDKYQPRSIASAIGDNFPYQLEKDYMADPSRQAKGENDLSVRITRSKSGIAGQTSKNQTWPTSCKNIKDGIHRDYLPREYQHGSVVAYLHDKYGTEIARKTFHPYYDIDGNVMYKENGSYGVKHQEFENKAREIERRLSPQVHDPRALYSLDDSKHYNDKDNSTAGLHPNLSTEQLSDLAKEHRKNSYFLEQIASHYNTSKSLLDKLMQSNFPSVKEAVLKNSNSDEDHANIGVKDRDSIVKATALEHKKLSPTTLINVIKDPYTESKYKYLAIKHKNLPSKVLDKFFDPEYVSRSDTSNSIKAALENPKINEQHALNVFNHGGNSLKQFVFKLNLLPKHILNDVNNKILYGSMEHLIKNIQQDEVRPETLKNILDHQHDFGLSRCNFAARHKNIDPEIFDSIFEKNSPHSHLMSSAVENPIVTPHHLDKAIKNGDFSAKWYALKNRLVSDDTLKSAATNPSLDDELRKLAQEHLDRRSN